MPLTKPARYSLVLVIAFYLTLSLWRIQVSPFHSHADGTWYDMVARNVATGRGLTEDCVWYFALPFQTVSHPIGNLFNPLCPIIVGGFYKLFGISDFVGRMPVFLMDGFLCLTVFLFSWHRIRSLPIAVFSSLLFTTHRFLLATRSGGGMPESFLLFFLTLCCYALIWAWEGDRKHYLTAALFGALAYLSRNEGGMSLPTLLILFGYREIWRPWRTCRTFPAPRTWGLLAAVLILFALVVLPWEIRNHLLFGPLANAAKYHFFMTRQYDDIWSYSQTFSLHQFFAMGWKKLLAIFATSYFYKLESLAEVTSWPILMFLPSAYLALRRQTWIAPILVYFSVSYVLMGALNHVSQNAGWNGVYVFLPFILPMALAGVAEFSRSATSSPRASARLFYVLALSLFVFQLAENVRFLHRQNKTSGDPKEMTMRVVQDWFIGNRIPLTSTVMCHFPYLLTYYTGIPSVIIPTNDPRTAIWEVADKFKCEYLILIGDNDPVFQSIYRGTSSDTRLTRMAVLPYRVMLGNGGDQIQIYRLGK